MEEKQTTESARRRHRHSGPGVGPAAVFFTLWAALTVFAWIVPLRPTVSLREKRNLEPFPTFSLASLADGSYFQRLGVWFSDTFPGRDVWIEADQSVERLYGRSDVVIYGNLDAGDAIPVPMETDAREPAAPTQMAASAAAAPTAAPFPGAETAPEPALAPEEPPAAETPPEDGEAWTGIDVDEEELVTLGAAIQIGERVFPYTGFSQYYSDQYAANISRAARLLEGKARVYSVFVLHSTTVNLPRDYRESIGCAPEEDILEYINGQLTDGAVGVDTYTPLLRHNSEYIYYRTDHHWTALGAWYAYEEWAGLAGVEPVGLDQYKEYAFSPFRGTLYYKANQSKKLKEDTVYAYEPPGDVHLFLQLNPKDSLDNLGYEQTLVTEIRGTDKYACFLTGDVPMATFVNNDITDGSACVIIKNSNGNPFCYYFSQHYQYTFVLDYRKYHNRSLTNFVDFYGVKDVIFCLSAGQAQSRGGNALLDQIIR